MEGSRVSLDTDAGHDRGRKGGEARRDRVGSPQPASLHANTDNLVREYDTAIPASGNQLLFPATPSPAGRSALWSVPGPGAER